jgi:putative ABC transport system substrate-binding protein
MTLIWRGGDQQLGQLPKLARELVNLRVRLILVDSSLSAFAAKEATSTIPIVLSHVGEPVGSGLVASLAHPGGNITSISLMTVELTAKRLEILKETVPKLSQVAVVWNPTHQLGKPQLETAVTAANQLGLKVQPILVRKAEDLAAAFVRIANRNQTGVLFTDDTMVWNQLNRIAGLSAKHSLPGIGGSRRFPEAGVLMSYAPSPKEQFQRAAVYVDKILKGVKPADLPVEQPTKLELVVNLKTAKALGITIPQSILVRADEVIR